MKITRLATILCVYMLFSCEKEDKDKTFRIVHLKPNRVHLNDERVTVNGWYAKTRNDFFTVKNYDINNEQHKIKIDSFIVNYMKKDSFLITNKNVNWKLTFFKYGKGIDENTEHEYGTDYTIHNLFSYKKEITSVYFDTRTGYSGSNYNITSEKFNQSKRKIISDYFTTLDLMLDKKREPFTLHLTAEPKNLDTIKVIARLIKQEEGCEFQMADYLVVKILQGKVSNDTIRVAYNPHLLPNKSKVNTILTLLDFDLIVGAKDHYYFPEYDGVKWSKEIKNKQYLFF